MALIQTSGMRGGISAMATSYWSGSPKARQAIEKAKPVGLLEWPEELDRIRAILLYREV
jgi:hypothetical protein